VVPYQSSNIVSIEELRISSQTSGSGGAL